MIVVTPTYNERGNVERHVRAVLAARRDASVLIVDDSSPDGTSALVAGLASEVPGRVELLTRPSKDGIGPAYVAGFQHALRQSRDDVIVQMDVDGSHSLADLPRLLAAAEAGADLAIGSRYCPGGRIEDWGWPRRAVSRGGNYYAHCALGGPVRDLTGGYKAWRAPLLRAVVGALVHCPSGYAFQIASTMTALALGADVREVPITFRDRAIGQSKMSSGIATEAMLSVLRIRRERSRVAPTAIGTGVLADHPPTSAAR